MVAVHACVVTACGDRHVASCTATYRVWTTWGHGGRHTRPGIAKEGMVHAACNVGYVSGVVHVGKHSMTVSGMRWERWERTLETGTHRETIAARPISNLFQGRMGYCVATRENARPVWTIGLVWLVGHRAAGHFHVCLSIVADEICVLDSLAKEH